jgi:hypothetical protein
MWGCKRLSHNMLYVDGKSKLANAGRLNGLRFPQIIANFEGVGYA